MVPSKFYVRQNEAADLWVENGLICFSFPVEEARGLPATLVAINPKLVTSFWEENGKVVVRMSGSGECSIDVPAADFMRGYREATGD